MQIRTFRAASLQAALEEIRQQMGPDASVLHTRQVRDGWMGWLGRSYVEVTAGLKEPNEETLTVPVDPSASQRVVDARNTSVSSHPMGVTPPLPTADRCTLPLNTNLESYRSELLSLGASPAAADRWLNATSSFAASLGELDDRLWLEHLQRSVARELRIAGPIRTQPGDRQVVALVGPTGVGKTTTIAKLAAGFRLEQKRRVGLLTIDTFRIAAVQQLKAYAEIMDLPMQVVEQPDQMEPAMDSLGDVDLVLIDTAGRSPRSDVRIEQLVELLRAAQPDETHLVLSATCSASAVQTILEGFSHARPTAAILTKLDEAPHTAGVLSAITASDRFAGIPVSYVTNGQQVPDDISTADVDNLVSRLLGSRDAMPQISAA
jgi:flagellar biosynthesis protein FlhF